MNSDDPYSLLGRVPPEYTDSARDLPSRHHKAPNFLENLETQDLLKFESYFWSKSPGRPKTQGTKHHLSFWNDPRHHKIGLKFPRRETDSAQSRTCKIESYQLLLCEDFRPHKQENRSLEEVEKPLKPFDGFFVPHLRDV